MMIEFQYKSFVVRFSLGQMVCIAVLLMIA